MANPKKQKAEATPAADIGTFKRMPAAKLEKLLAKGREEAAELDKTIRSQFELSEADGALRLR